MLPFADIAHDGNSAAPATDLQKLNLGGGSNSSVGDCCPPGLIGGATEGMLQVKWRALLRDAAEKTIPDPTVQFELVGSPASAFTAAPAAAPISLPSAQQLRQQPVATVRPQDLAATAAAEKAVATAAVAPAHTAGDGPVPMPVANATSPHDSKAVRRVRLASKLLEEAASIPVEVCAAVHCNCLFVWCTVLCICCCVAVSAIAVPNKWVSPCFAYCAMC